jgi:hypothetical protein
VTTVKERRKRKVPTAQEASDERWNAIFEKNHGAAARWYYRFRPRWRSNAQACIEESMSCAVKPVEGFPADWHFNQFDR